MSENEMVANPFGSMQQRSSSAAASTDIEAQRAIAEVQARLMFAFGRPRDEIMVADRILKACTRKSLAEAALYAYPRGGELITGPSIRLAECIQQNWPHLDAGWRELSSANGESLIECYAWDMQTNVRATRTFTVKHVRYSRSGGIKKLTDPRDIYENNANQAARRLRAVILQVIPGDVVEAAVKQCEITQTNTVGAPDEQIAKLVEAFSKYGVDETMLMRRLGHNLDATTTAEIVSLKRVYTSIRDGMAPASSYFDMPAGEGEGASALADKLQGKQPAGQQPAGKPDQPAEQPGAPASAPAPAENAATGATGAHGAPADEIASEAVTGARGKEPDVPSSAAVVAAFGNARTRKEFMQADEMCKQLKSPSRLVIDARAMAVERLAAEPGAGL